LAAVTSWYSACHSSRPGCAGYRHARVVGVANGDDAAGARHAAHLAQRGHGVREVLQHLVRVHDVERVVLELQRVRVTDLEAHVRRALLGRVLGGDGQHGGGPVDTHDVTRGDAGREVHRDGARAAAHVEQPLARLQRRQQVTGGVLRRAPPVRAQHALVVAVRVDVVGPRGHRAL